VAEISISDLEDFSDLIDDEDGEQLTDREIRKLALKDMVRSLRILATKTAKMTEAERIDFHQMLEEAERIACELSLAVFFKCAWPHMDPAPYQHNWHIDITAAAAEKLITGESRNLIVNQPPRTSKSNLLSVAFPAWIWAQSEKGPVSGPQVKFLAASYGQNLSHNLSSLCRSLILSPWYQKHWGKRFQLKDDRNAVGFFENDKGGHRMATSVGAALTGLGGDALILDDVHNTQEVESEASRQAVVNWYSQSLSTRLNDMRTGIKLVVMQRQHEEDLTGYLLDNEPEMWDHIVFRMRYEGNPFLEYDPREEEGELLWPARMPDMEVTALEKTLGTYGTQGQLQQRPSPKGGGIIRAEDWVLFPPENRQEEWKRDGVLCWPPFEFVLASLDTSSTEAEENDPCAFTIWGLWYDETGMARLVVIYAWEEFLSFNKLVMRVGNNCRKFKPDILLIEAKANGISVSQEIQRVFGISDWSTVLQQVKGDKVARAISVQGLFEDKMIYAPDREWAQLVIDRCAQFPKGKRKDIVDTVTQAVRWFRDNGLLSKRDEVARRRFEALPRPGDSIAELPPYDC
jgi:predicted phage terminase large subunit-like protein